MYKISNHLKLDTKGIKTYEQLCNHIDNHLDYCPPENNKKYHELEADYCKLKQEYFKIKDM